MPLWPQATGSGYPGSSRPGKTEMQAFLPLLLPVKIDEFGVLLVECGHYGAGRAVPVLADDDLGHAGVF